MTARTRPGTRTDRAAVVRLLGRAFAEDPVYRWLLPDPVVRGRRLPGLMRTLMSLQGRDLRVVVAELDGRTAGAALWVGPGHGETGGVRLVRALPGLVAAVGPRGLPRLRLLGEQLEAARPPEPHHYLFHLAADPDLQGRGVGTALLAAGPSPAYLECKRALVPYYARAGFTERGEAVVEPGALSVVTMWRPAGP